MHVSHAQSGRPSFIRDRFTWTAYLLLAYFAYLQGLQGPIIPFLRTELGLSYTLGSLHVSAVALGMVLVGLFGDRIIRALGSRVALWGGAAGMALGALGLVLGSHVAVTIAASACMGLIGALLVTTQQTALAHHHGPQSTIAFTEGNIAASLAALCAPLMVGSALSMGLGWRTALLLPLPLVLILFLRERRQPVPEPDHQEYRQDQEHRTTRPLALRFWAFWTVACLSVAAEWSIGFWGTDYLHTIVGLPLEVAVTTLSVFYVAMLVGRIAGSYLARHFMPIQLLAAALLIALMGVLLLWRAELAALNLFGLALAGLGIGNLFPMSLAGAVETAAGQLVAASARMTLAGGSAILVAPLLLGGWADRVGLRNAFGMVPVILMLALMVIAFVWRTPAGRPSHNTT